MARHKVEICGVNTANMKVLTPEENRELFQKMKNGDAQARDDLINADKSYACRRDKTGDLCAALIMRDGWEISKDYPW